MIMENISDILSGLSVLYAFVFIYAQILSDKIEKFMERDSPMCDGNEMKAYMHCKRTLCWKSLAFSFLNLLIAVLSIFIIVDVIKVMSGGHIEILQFFVMLIFICQIVNFIYSIVLCSEIFKA